MKIVVCSITAAKKGVRATTLDSLAAQYAERTVPYSAVESAVFRSEEALFDHLEKQRGRTSPLLVLLDSRGKAFKSEELAAWLGRQRDEGRQAVFFAIGPADGWSEAARGRAGLLLSFGPMTLPHELVKVVFAEQLYRAFTILAGHPYHSGH